MSLEKTDALVIRQADFSESSRVVTFFTRDYGRISAVARGGRRLKGPFEAALDLLTECRIVFLRKSSGALDILTEAQLVSRFRPGGRSLVSLYGGYYVAELLSSLTEDYDPHPELYRAAVAALHSLQSTDDPRLAIVRFEVAILQEIGQLPQWDECLVCGEPVAGQEGGYGFWVSQGGMICRKCQKEEFRQQRIHAGTIAVLRRLSAEDATADQVSVSDARFREMRSLLTSAISGILGRRPRTLSWLQF